MEFLTWKFQLTIYVVAINAAVFHAFLLCIFTHGQPNWKSLQHLYTCVSYPTHHFAWWSNGNIFHVTSPLCGEFTGHRWISLTKTSDAELWCFTLIYAWTIGWINNRDVGDMRHHRAHYDVMVMEQDDIETFQICPEARAIGISISISFVVVRFAVSCNIYRSISNIDNEYSKFCITEPCNTYCKNKRKWTPFKCL